MSEQLDELRESFDGSDQFMQGHQILKARTGRPRIVPVWAKDDVRLREVVYKIFPKMFDDKRQRARAGRTLRVVYLYYRSNYTAQDIALDMDLSLKAVERTLERVRAIAVGKWGNGRGEHGRRPRGRPRITPTIIENSGGNETARVGTPTQSEEG